MKKLQSILCASLLTLSICSAAFANTGLIDGGKAGLIDGGKTGLIDGGKAGLIDGGAPITAGDIMGIMIYDIALIIP
jgi:hypothetical protein